MNRDEDLLEALGEAAKDRDEEDDRWWDAVAAKDASALPSEEAVEALRPLDDAEMDGIADMLLAAEKPAVEADEGGAKVVSIFSARRWAAPAGALLAVAAAALLFLSTPNDAMLPRYALDVRSGEKVVRGDDHTQTEITAYSDGATFDFVLVPDERVTEDVALAAVVIGDGGEKIWDAPFTRLDGGTLRVRGVVGEQLDLAPGDWRVVFFVGPKDRLPTTPTNETPSGVQRFEAQIRVR